MNYYKKILRTTVFGIILLFTTHINAQRGEDYTIVNSEELVQLFHENDGNNLRTGFCHDITVTVNLEIIEIETTVTMCCSNDPLICVPVINTRAAEGQIPLPNDLEISNSSSVNQGSYAITIVDGRYPVNGKGEINGLKYKLTSK